MSDARAFAARNRQGSDWFSHDSASQPAAVAAPGRRPAPVVREAAEAAVAPIPAANNNNETTTGGRAEMIKPSCNSNQWYKYDSTSSSDGGSPAASKPSQSKTQPQAQPLQAQPPQAQPHQAATTGDWYSNEKTSAEEQRESKPRVMTTEGESNCRRDKAGSSASWFAHDHAAEDAAAGAARVNAKEGGTSAGANATRMRGQSENWFSHEAAGRTDGGGVVDPESLHLSKGRAAAQKAQTSEMHDVFHMK